MNKPTELKIFTFHNVRNKNGKFYITNYRNKSYVLVIYEHGGFTTKQVLNYLGLSLKIVNEIITNNNTITRKSGNLITEFNTDN